jgi:DNA-binding IclR family transcriptional regulator
MPSVRRLLAELEEKGMLAESRRRKKVELSVRGMVRFPSGWRGWRVMVVARSALFR